MTTLIIDTFQPGVAAELDWSKLDDGTVLVLAESDVVGADDELRKRFEGQGPSAAADASLEHPITPTDRYGSADRGSRSGPVSDLELFHLPGQHDQRTHGRRYLHVGDDPFVHAGPQGHAADEAALWHVDLHDLAGLVQSVESGVDESKTRELSGGENGAVFHVTFNDGSVGVLKITQDTEPIMGPGEHSKAVTQADSEQLGAALGRAIGAPVPRVLRTGPNEMYMEYAEGTPWSAFAYHPNARPDSIFHATQEIAKDPGGAGKRLGLLDLLTDNWDRNNPSNWLLDQNDEPVGYDHSYLWNGVTDPGGASGSVTSPGGPEQPPAADVVGPFSLQYFDTSTAIDWGLNDLTSQDVEYVTAHLEDLEDDFAAVGRHDWWQFTMDRWDVVKRFANGKAGENVIAPPD